MSLELASKIVDGVMSDNIAIETSYPATGSLILEKCFGKELACFFDSQDFTELMINGTENIFVEQDGRLIELDLKVDDRAIDMFLDIVSNMNSRNIDFGHPIFDGKLPDGYRCNVVVPPVSLSGPLITLRRHIKKIDSISYLITSGMLSQKMSQVLVEALADKQNIIVAGGTSTGKTTMVNVLFNSLLELLGSERIITIEDTAELNIRLKHVLKLESRFKTPDCALEVTVRDLVKTALRMRPDRIVVGEVRGEEAYDLLHAVNTGHKGTVCTIHANSCRDALRRLETLAVLGHPNLDINIPRSWIASNINIVVFIEKVAGKRKVVDIQKIIGVESDNYILETLTPLCYT